MWGRREVSVETRVTPVGGESESSLAARILDVSSGGARLLVGRAFQPGELLSVDLPSRPGEPPSAVLACVAHSRPEGETDCVVGCRFSAELSDADLAAFGGARTRSAAPDDRNWSRIPCTAKALYATVGDDDEAPHEAKVMNISAGGVALLVDRDVRTGALLSTELHAPDGRLVVTILACVVHVTEQSETERLLGCNFIQELGEGELQALA